MSKWSVKDSLELYDVPAWSAGFFGILPNGHLEVRGSGEDNGPSLDLYELTRDLQQRGV
ncbi:MAG: hypothetical protein JRC77_06700, partial [Deltaproteobacteria bacterium]|nr:hypothetical protein [Deltaproteobacteria bacterium]